MVTTKSITITNNSEKDWRQAVAFAYEVLMNDWKSHLAEIETTYKGLTVVITQPERETLTITINDYKDERREMERL